MKKRNQPIQIQNRKDILREVENKSFNKNMKLFLILFGLIIGVMIIIGIFIKILNIFF